MQTNTNYKFLLDSSGNPVTQQVVGVTDSSGNPVTGYYQYHYCLYKFDYKPWLLMNNYLF